MLRKLVIGSALALLFSINIDGVQAATQYHQVSIQDDGTLTCENCLADRMGAVGTMDTDFNFLSKVKGETRDYALIYDNGGTGCPAGYWYVLDKGAPSTDALKELELDTCTEVSKVTVSQKGDVFTAKFHLYDGSIKKVTYK